MAESKVGSFLGGWGTEAIREVRMASSHHTPLPEVPSTLSIPIVIYQIQNLDYLIGIILSQR